MKTKHLVPLFAVLAGLALPAIASAQAANSGWDLRLSLDYSRVIFDQDIRQTLKIGTTVTTDKGLYDSRDRLNGFGGTLSIGYRWGYFGAYIEQDFSSIYPENDQIQNYKDMNFHFLGGTYAVARGILPLGEKIEFNLAAGIGVMYSDGDPMEKQQSASGDGTDVKVPIIINEDGKASAAFALKAAAGATFYINSFFGLGLDVDYTIAFNKLHYDLTIATIKYNMEIKNYVHHIKPALHVRFRF